MMVDMVIKRQGSYCFGGAVGLSDTNARRLVHQMQTATQDGAASVLGGRRAISIITLEGIGRVVIKHYHRGGLLARLVKQTYLRTGKPRCQHEFEQMAFARSIGVCTPDPVAFAYKGGIFYQGWLVTKEIKGQQSLATLSSEDPKRAAKALTALVGQVERLIQHKVLHADFHPGNVLVDDRDRIFLIDFDKAHLYSGSREKLKERYKQRWQRAVDKHGLPRMLDDMRL